MATASDSTLTLFNQAVSRIVNSWAALQIAVDHGFGGVNSRQKAQDLVNDIEDLFTRNENIDPHDFASLLEDEVDSRFDLLLEDDSALMVAHHICQSFSLLKGGNIPEVIKFLDGLPAIAQNKTQFAGEVSSSDDDDETEDVGNAATGSQLQMPLHNGQSVSPGTSADQFVVTNAGDVDMVDAEEDDGWTVVQKGGKKRR